MNSVHLVTQEKYRVKNEVANIARCTSTKTGPAGPACALVAVSWAAWPCLGRVPPAVSQRKAAVSQRKAAVSQRNQRAPACPRIRSSRLLPRAPAPRAPAPVSLSAPRPLTPACAGPARPAPAQPYRRPCLASCHNTTLLYCNTKSLLCATHLGSSPSTLLHQNIFFFNI